MTTYLLAGGGTAGHVNPLLAVADALREREPADTVLVVGTAEGLEARLVPARGYELLTIPRVPFPRRPDLAALRFPAGWRRAVRIVQGIIAEHAVDVVVGFGGYASAPAYRAARRAGVPIVLHEANARPGIANRLGARWAAGVGTAFPGTPLPGAQLVGMPLRREIAQLDRGAARAQGQELFGLDPQRPTLLVTGGSLGARRINQTITARAEAILAAGYQILHIWGGLTELDAPERPGHILMRYCERMDLALAVADVAFSRAGAATVSELTGLGIPAVYVPYAVGNGEQRFNVASVVEAGGALVVADAECTPEWVDRVLLPLLADEPRLRAMGEAARQAGILDGAERMVALVDTAIARPGDVPLTP